MFTSKKKCNEVYLPIEGDIILGIVAEKSSSHLLIDCKAKKLAKLLVMNSARDLLLKSDRIQIGTVLCCRVHTIGYKCTSFTVSCSQSAATHALLQKGFIFQVLPLVARMLLHSKDVLTKSINISHPLEIAVGYNGLIWFHSRPSATEMQFLLLISKYYAQ
jgi:exosome complex RNA-binding protein Rrp4